MRPANDHEPPEASSVATDRDPRRSRSRGLGPGRRLLDGAYDRMRFERTRPVWTTREAALLALALALVAVTRFVFVVRNPAALPAGYSLSDESGYLLLGRDFSDWIRHGNAIRGPGYPALIALFGARPRAIQTAQIALELVALAALLVGVRRFWGRLAAAFAAFLWLLYAPFAYYDHVFLSESLNLALTVPIGLVLLVLWNRESRRPLAACALLGVLIGLEELVRPTSWYLFMLLTALVVWRAGRWRERALQALAVAAAALIVVAPWIARNYAIYGRPLSGSGTGHATFTGVLPLSLVASARDLGPPTPALERLGYHFPFRPLRNDRIGLFSDDDVARDALSRKLLWRFVREDASDYWRPMLSEHARRPFRVWLKSAIAEGENAVYRPHRGDRYRGLFEIVHVAVLGVGLLSVALLRQLRRDTLPWLAWIVAATLAVTLTLLPQARYALPLMPFVLAWAAIGCAALVSVLRAAHSGS